MRNALLGLGRLHADRDQRRIGGGRFDAARDRALSAQAVIAYDPYARTRRPRRPLRPRRSCGPDRTRWTGGTLISLRPRRANLARVTLRPLAATAKRGCRKNQRQ